MSTSREGAEGGATAPEKGTMSEQLVAAARDMAREPNPQATLEMAVSLAADLVDSAEHASITLIHRRRGQRTLETPAATDTVGRRLDELQYELDQGPCIDAIDEHEVITSPEIGEDGRWPEWGPRAAEATDVRSMLCLRLFTHSDLVGALNLHSERPDAFTDVDVDDGVAVAAHAAIAVSSAVRVENLEAALDSRTVTGQATGFVMARYDLDAPTAFAVLARISSHTNRRLRDVAAEVIDNRALPDD